MKGPLLLGLLAGVAGVWIARLRYEIGLLKKEIGTMGFTAAQQAQLDAALAARDAKILAIVNAAVAKELGEIKAQIQIIEAKVTEGTFTPADMQKLVDLVSNTPATLETSIAASIDSISSGDGADAGGSGGGNGDNPNPDAP